MRIIILLSLISGPALACQADSDCGSSGVCAFNSSYSNEIGSCVGGEAPGNLYDANPATEPGATLGKDCYRDNDCNRGEDCVDNTCR